MSKNWTANRRQDHYYHRAKAENYRSRAAFKLLQMGERYHIFKEGDVVIDLGANPGGWCQAAREMIGVNGIIIGIDLKPIEPIKGVHFIRGDARSERVRMEINTILYGDDVPETKDGDEPDFNSRKVNIVCSDMSPKISGAYSTDHARSIELAELSLKFAEDYLKPGGGYVVKVFDGDMTHDFFREIKKKFRMTKRHSPIASRNSSSEIYIIALGYRTH